MDNYRKTDCMMLAGEGCGNLQTYCPQFCAPIRHFVSLIVFTPGTQLNIHVLLIPVISENWIDSSTSCWLMLLI